MSDFTKTPRSMFAVKVIGRVALTLLCVMLAGSPVLAQPSTLTESALSCGCTEINIKCVLDEEFAEICGAVSPNALACATNKPRCNMFLKLDTCRALGLSTTTTPVPPLSTSLDCSTYVRGESPETGLALGRACCVVRHESVHNTDPNCGPRTSVACTEERAYVEDERCHRDLAQALCEQHPESEECRQACADSVQRSTIFEMYKCGCEASPLGRLSNETMQTMKECAYTCFALAPEKSVPPACPTNYPPLGGVRDLAVHMCKDFFGLTGSNQTSSSAAIPTGAPEATPTATPEPTPEPTPSYGGYSSQPGAMPNIEVY